MEKLVGKRYFNIAEDFKVIKDGGFFCQACLVGKDKAAISPDPRYCQDCYDVLREAMETDARWSHSASISKLMEGRSKNGKRNRSSSTGSSPGNTGVFEATGNAMRQLLA